MAVSVQPTAHVIISFEPSIQNVWLLLLYFTCIGIYSLYICFRLNCTTVGCK